LAANGAKGRIDNPNLHVLRAAKFFVTLKSMEYQRSDRVGDLILEVIAELLRKDIRDPRVQTVTLTGVKVSKDLRNARVYFNIRGGQDSRINAAAGLKSASGFIRSRVGKQLNLRFVPAIEFTYDDSEDEAQRIDELLKQVKS
jgi:ribosome-binding factor A